MSVYLPNDLKEAVAATLRDTLCTYAQFNEYRVKRVTQDGANVHLMLTGPQTPQGVTYMLNITVKEVR